MTKLSETELNLRTEIAILKDRMNNMVNEAIEKVRGIPDTEYHNGGMGHGFEYYEDKSPVQIKNEVIKILNTLRPGDL